MSRRFFLSLSLLVLALARHAGAQTGERDRDTYNPSTSSVDITGQVRLDGGTAVAAGVRVVLERMGGGTLDQMSTDARGRFRFASLPRGHYVINVSAPCHQTERRQVELVLVFRSYLDIDLKRDTTSPVCAAARAAPVGLVDARVPEEARKEYERGSDALAKGKDEDGVRALGRAVTLYPGFFAAHMLLASAHTKAGRLAEAEESLERASKIDSRSAAALISLGEVQRRRQRHNEAEKSLAAGLALDGESWQGHLSLGRLYLDTDRLKEAARHIARALQLKSDFAETHLFAGNLLLKLGEGARALSEYEEYLRLAPKGDFAAPTRELVARLRKSLEAKRDD